MTITTTATEKGEIEGVKAGLGVGSQRPRGLLCVV